MGGIFVAETIIEWTWRRLPSGAKVKGYTFNPWHGCTKVSAACDSCYALTLSKRWGRDIWGHKAPRFFTNEAYWNQLDKWNAEAAKDGEPRFVFCGSMCDICEILHAGHADRERMDAARRRIFEKVETVPYLIFLFLTKRPQNFKRLVPESWMREDEWPKNAWVGTTIEDKQAYLDRASHLAALPAPVKFWSCEPLLEDITEVLPPWPTLLAMTNWILCGGESGRDARPMNPDWARNLRDRAREARIPFHFKQWGEWTPGENVDRVRGTVQTATWFGGRWILDSENLAHTDGHCDDQPDLYRVGKKAAGRYLDGRTWDEFPAVLS
jgi:protein gp37